MLTLVPAEKVDGVWDWVRAGLVATRDKVGAAWHPSDIYNACVTKKAFLYTIGQDDGFIVLQPTTDFDGMTLFVWVLYGPNETRQYEAEIEDELKRMGRQMGARRIVHQSPFHAWKKAGWKVRAIIYEKEL